MSEERKPLTDEELDELLEHAVPFLSDDDPPVDDLGAQLVRAVAELREARADNAALVERAEHLRGIVIQAHGMAAGRYVQSDTEMRNRIAALLDHTINADPVMAGFLGRIPGNDMMSGGSLKGGPHPGQNLLDRLARAEIQKADLAERISQLVEGRYDSGECAYLLPDNDQDLHDDDGRCTYAGGRCDPDNCPLEEDEDSD